MAPLDKFLQFANGQKMPVIGLGMWQGGKFDDEEVERVVEQALEIGYRHFDTAFMYNCEAAMGKGLKKWLDSGKGMREDLFIVSKLPWNGNSVDKVENFLKLSLNDLQLDYVDLYLMHWPCSVKYISDREVAPRGPDGKILIDPNTSIEAVWRGMEAQVDAGRAKSIGLSNFNEKQIERIMKAAKIKPANLQVELHGYLQQRDLRAVCKKHNLTVCGFAPLGAPWKKTYPGLEAEPNDSVNLLNDPVVNEIATKHNRSAAQILLHYYVEILGVASIPKSSNPARLRSNIDIFDFELDADDKKRLEALDRGEAGRNTFPWGELKQHPENPF